MEQADQSPDERHDFLGWSVERIQERCFFIEGSVNDYGAGIARREITCEEFDSLVDGSLSVRDIRRRFDLQMHQRFERGNLRRAVTSFALNDDRAPLVVILILGALVLLNELT